MNLILAHALTALVGYLIGSIPFGVLVARSKGVNLREQGSGNVGATNVGRVLGLKWFFFVFALDFCKGLAPVLLAVWLAQPLFGIADASRLTQGDLPLAAGVAACLGHVFSLFLGFRGGKAVATGVGMLTALSPSTAGASLLIFLVLFWQSRIVSVASMGASLLAPFIYALSASTDWGKMGSGMQTLSHQEVLRLGVITLLSALILIKHRSNFRRLLKGEEKRVGKQHESDQTSGEIEG